MHFFLQYVCNIGTNDVSNGTVDKTLNGFCLPLEKKCITVVSVKNPKPTRFLHYLLPYIDKVGKKCITDGIIERYLSTIVKNVTNVKNSKRTFFHFFLSKRTFLTS